MMLAVCIHRRFQVEVIAMFLEDLEWCVQEWRPQTTSLSDEAGKSLETVMGWLRKLVRLLPAEPIAAAASTRENQLSFSQQLDERLHRLALSQR
jgi:hypothetical protein